MQLLRKITYAFIGAIGLIVSLGLAIPLWIVPALLKPKEEQSDE